jgi:hypothetical protein
MKEARRPNASAKPPPVRLPRAHNLHAGAAEGVRGGGGNSRGMNTSMTQNDSSRLTPLHIAAAAQIDATPQAVLQASCNLCM